MKLNLTKEYAAYLSALSCTTFMCCTKVLSRIVVIVHLEEDNVKELWMVAQRDKGRKKLCACQDDSISWISIES